jgi:hypothetical protein
MVIGSSVESFIHRQKAKHRIDTGLRNYKFQVHRDPYEFDSDTAKKEIQELRDQHELSVDEKEWLDELEDEADQGEYAYIAKAMDHPGSFETEMIPHGKTYKYSFKVILDAFDEICNRLTLDEEKKLKDDLAKEC